MKKFITLFVVAALGFAVIGCGKAEEPAADAGTTSAAAPKDNTPKMDEEGGEKTDAKTTG